MRILITGGGTGGHVYPAIAIADEFKKRFPDSEILFVGAQGKLEMEKVPAKGYKIIGLKIRGLNKKFSFDTVKSVFLYLGSVFKAKKILKNFKPDIIIGVGGYASAAVLFAAKKKYECIFLQEQNSYPGFTNRYFVKFAKKIFVAYEGMEKYLPAEKISVTGNPVRNILERMPEKQEALEYFGFQPDMPVIFLTGGSLGARTLNESILRHLDLLLKSNVQLLWQTGKIYYEEMLERTKNIDLQGKVVIKPFIDKMEYAYASADLIISRAGAITISELTLIGKPVIFVPSPNVAEDHQKKNALALAENNAALMVEDKEAPEKLLPLAVETLRNPELMTNLGKNIKKFAKPTATQEIVKQIVEECNLKI